MERGFGLRLLEARANGDYLFFFQCWMLDQKGQHGFSVQYSCLDSLGKYIDIFTQKLVGS